MTRIVTVFGATGTQGSSVINALLADGTFTPRAVSRHPESEASRKLIASGVQVVQGDLGDKESIKKAVAGSEGVFGVTNPYDATVLSSLATNPKAEVDLGKNLIDASKEAGVKFFVWSSLPSSNLISNGKYPQMLHFDNKYEIEEYLRSSGLPHANIHTGIFAENINNFHQLTPASSGGYELNAIRSPITLPVPWLWVEKDLGPSVLALLKSYKDTSKEILGQTFVVVSERLTYAETIKTFEEVIGKPVGFKSAATSGAPSLDGMWDFIEEFGFYGVVPDPRLVALGVKFSTIRSFAEETIKTRLY